MKRAAVYAITLFSTIISTVLIQEVSRGEPLVTREDELQRIHPSVSEERFAAMDLDGSGTVSLDEYLKAYPDENPAVLRARFEVMDENESEDLNWYEMANAPVGRAIAEIEFQELDADGSGDLSLNEFSRYFPNLEAEDRAEKFRLVDFNKNGVIDPGEWKEISEIE
ncbi:MAG: EF-hand domain-containing protein [Desulfovibrionales bacterium]